MAYGLPSAEQMREFLISQGVDAEEAAKRANAAARSNAAQAARTSALSLAAGAAPARAAVEATPALARSAMGIGERVAAAPRQVFEFLTKPKPVTNPETGYILQNVGYAGRPRPRPDLKWGVNLAEFTPAQRVAQGALGAGVIGAGSMGASELADRLDAGQVQGPPMPPNYPNMPEVQGPPEMQGPMWPESGGAGRGYINEQPGERAAYEKAQAVAAARQRMTAAQATGERAPQPMRRPDEGILSKIFSGKDYQSNNELVNKPMGGAPVNWGNSDSAADFFRADKALMAQRQADEGYKRGGAANAKPDSVHKALEIIHHLLTRSH
jgi:hypothetical protein